MTPEGLARVATPDLFGLYDVIVDRRMESSLFDNLSNEFKEAVWHLHVQKALFELSPSTLRELQDPYNGEVPVAFTCKINMREMEPTVKILITPVEFITDLIPVPKQPDHAAL